MVFANLVTGERRRLGGSGAVAEARRLEAAGWVRTAGAGPPAIRAEDVRARIEELEALEREAAEVLEAQEKEPPKPKPKRRRASRKKGT